MGAGKDDQMRRLMSDKASVLEVTRFRQQLTERYGHGQVAIREGVEADPAMKTKPASERSLVQTRVSTVVQAMPTLIQMRETIRQRDRAPDLGKDQGRGIER